jgi:hypothetical protein
MYIDDPSSDIAFESTSQPYYITQNFNTHFTLFTVSVRKVFAGHFHFIDPSKSVAMDFFRAMQENVSDNNGEVAIDVPPLAPPLVLFDSVARPYQDDGVATLRS